MRDRVVSSYFNDRIDGRKEMVCMGSSMNMSVSSVCVKDGKQYAFVSFTDGARCADGKIPDCKIVSSNGFTETEVEQLEAYMKRELTQLKKMAAGVRWIDAFMK